MQNFMQDFQKFLRGVSFVGQLGLTIITPPLLMIFLAHLLMTRCGWGVWVMVVGIVFGLISSVLSAVSFYKKIMQHEKKRKPDNGVSFTKHI